MLAITRQNMPFFPKGIVSFFKNVHSLRFWQQNLVSLTAKDLEPFPNLLLLSLVGNKLTYLGGDLFSSNRHLQFLDFTGNDIQRIQHNLVTHLNNLEMMFFTANSCIDRSARTRAEVLELAPVLSILCPPWELRKHSGRCVFCIRHYLNFYQVLTQKCVFLLHRPVIFLFLSHSDHLFIILNHISSVLSTSYLFKKKHKHIYVKTKFQSTLHDFINKKLNISNF